MIVCLTLILFAPSSTISSCERFWRPPILEILFWTKKSFLSLVKHPKFSITLIRLNDKSKLLETKHSHFPLRCHFKMLFTSQKQMQMSKVLGDVYNVLVRKKFKINMNDVTEIKHEYFLKKDVQKLPPIKRLPVIYQATIHDRNEITVYYKLVMEMLQWWEHELAFHQCVPGSFPGLSIISGLSLLVLYSASKSFSPGNPVFPSHQKPIFDLI